MAVMGLDDLLEEAVDFCATVDFSKSQSIDEQVSVFETTIRYLGGLLSAYELAGKRHSILVQKAREVGDKMAFAWRSPDQAVPYPRVVFSRNQALTQGTNIAEAGTLALEWFTLSKYTGNGTYAALGVGALEHIAGLTPPLPGLAARSVDPTSGRFTNSFVGWGGGSDSYFEYLVKFPRLTNTDDQMFLKTWHTAVDSSINTLLRTGSVGGWQYLGDWDAGRYTPVSSHLECFHGGNWLMGGRMLNNQTIVDIGLDLVDSCWNSYASTPTGIGPEAFRWFPQGTEPTITGDNLRFYQEHGFYITSPGYILRPEVLESNFIAWRVTGDTKYLDRAADAIESFNAYLRNTTRFEGYAGINNVNRGDGGGFRDDTESFWFAEVLKYLYLTFDDPSRISLDEWVFNTEAHPFEAPPALRVYTDGELLPPSDELFSPISEFAGGSEVVSGRIMPTGGI